MTQRYWFARRHASQTGQPTWSGRFRPISWEGWVCMLGFVVMMALGLALWVEASAQGVQSGWMGFVFLTVIGMGALFIAIRAKGDPNHTAADYKTGKVKNGDGS